MWETLEKPLNNVPLWLYSINAQKNWKKFFFFGWAANKFRFPERSGEGDWCIRFLSTICVQQMIQYSERFDCDRHFRDGVETRSPVLLHPLPVRSQH